MSSGADSIGARVSSDPGFRRLVQTARAWGVPPTIFLGRKRVTTYYHDGALRQVRAEADAEWTDEDRDLALALAAYEADLCPGCHQPLSETTNPENEDRYKTGRALLCHRCVATEIAGKAYEGHDHPGALLIPVELRT
jgi:hypothetical protein